MNRDEHIKKNTAAASTSPKVRDLPTWPKTLPKNIAAALSPGLVKQLSKLLSILYGLSMEGQGLAAISLERERRALDQVRIQLLLENLQDLSWILGEFLTDLGG